jgi:hypothetical protein
MAANSNSTSTNARNTGLGDHKDQAFLLWATAHRKVLWPWSGKEGWNDMVPARLLGGLQVWLSCPNRGQVKKKNKAASTQHPTPTAASTCLQGGLGANSWHICHDPPHAYICYPHVSNGIFFPAQAKVMGIPLWPSGFLSSATHIISSIE